ncbi:MAG: FAD-dependent oxidoreductase [Spirochaetota bacterium]
MTRTVGYMIQEVVFQGEQFNVEQAVLLDWSVEVGDVIDRGETICTVETPSGVAEVPAGVGGQIIQLHFSPGDEIPSGTPVALVGEPGEALTDDLGTPGVSVDPEEMLRQELPLSSRARSPEDGSGEFDLFVIGGGPAGYRAAAKASAAGARVALAESSLLGGVCLNYGCIPAKSLINTARIYRNAVDSAHMGIEASTVGYNHSRARDWKNRSVDRTRNAIEHQLDREGVQVIRGHAQFNGPGSVTVDGTRYTSKYVLIATGGDMNRLEFDTTQADIPVIGSSQAFDIDNVPTRILIVGGGYIGLEIAGLFNALGSYVTVMETGKDILQFAGSEIGRQMRLAMEDVTFIVNARPTQVRGRTVYYDDNGSEARLEADCVVQVAGRKPRIEGLDTYGLELDETGVKVDDHMRTNLDGVYAAGDVTGRLMLAHAAFRMADVAVNSMFGDGKDTLRMDTMPWIVYTMPELAGCGLNTAQAKEKGYNTSSNLLPLATNNRYFSEHEDPRGWCRLVSDADSGKLLGAFMMGHGVSEIIAQAVMALEAGMKLSDIAQVVSPHPTVSEAFRDAADTAGHLSKVMASDQLGNPHL